MEVSEGQYRAQVDPWLRALYEAGIITARGGYGGTALWFLIEGKREKLEEYMRLDEITQGIVDITGIDASKIKPETLLGEGGLELNADEKLDLLIDLERRFDLTLKQAFQNNVDEKWTSVADIHATFGKPLADKRATELAFTEIVDKAKEAVSEETGAPKEKLLLSTSLINDLAVDEVGLVQIILNLEEAFEIGIDENDSKNISVMESIYRLVAAKRRLNAKYFDEEIAKLRLAEFSADRAELMDIDQIRDIVIDGIAEAAKMDRKAVGMGTPIHKYIKKADRIAIVADAILSGVGVNITLIGQMELHVSI